MKTTITRYTHDHGPVRKLLHRGLSTIGLVMLVQAIVLGFWPDAPQLLVIIGDDADDTRSKTFLWSVVALFWAETIWRWGLKEVE